MAEEATLPTLALVHSPTMKRTSLKFVPCRTKSTTSPPKRHPTLKTTTNSPISLMMLSITGMMGALFVIFAMKSADWRKNGILGCYCLLCGTVLIVSLILSDVSDQLRSGHISIESSVFDTIVVCFAEAPASREKNYPGRYQEMLAGWNQAYPEECSDDFELVPQA